MKNVSRMISPPGLFCLAVGLLAVATAAYLCCRCEARERPVTYDRAAVVFDTALPVPVPSLDDVDCADDDQAGDTERGGCPSVCDCGCQLGFPCVCVWRASQERKNFVERWQVRAWELAQVPRRYDPDAWRRKNADNAGPAAQPFDAEYCDPRTGQCFSGSWGVSSGGCSSGSCGVSSEHGGGGRRGLLRGGRRGGRGACCGG